MNNCYVFHKKQCRPEHNRIISLKCRQAGGQAGEKKKEQKGETLKKKIIN